MFVKICGITRAADAQAAVEHGASAIGFVFWSGSPRRIAPEQARAIAAGVPASVAVVGVFVNEDPTLVNRIADSVGLTSVQLHGDETPDYMAGIERPVVKAFPVTDATQPEDADVWATDVRLLLDVADRGRRGGTGRLVNWPRAAGIAARREILLAGGLSADNVAEAVRCVKPFGIDVSSGVEAAAGIKDHARIKALFEAVAKVTHAP